MNNDNESTDKESNEQKHLDLPVTPEEEEAFKLLEQELLKKKG